MHKPAHVAVLGGGPAGMTAAWRLAEHGIAATVIEREAAVGGMARTIHHGRYAVDFGPHTFHIRNTEESRRIIETIRPFFGPDPLVLTRGTRVLLHGKYYVYPLELMQVLTGLNPLLSLVRAAGARMTVDFASGAPVTVNQVVRAMADACGVTVQVRHEGHTEEFIEFRSVDRTMAERFGFAPTVSLADGLTRLRDHLRAPANA